MHDEPRRRIAFKTDPMILADTPTLYEACQKYRERFAWLPGCDEELCDKIISEHEWWPSSKGVRPDFLLGPSGSLGIYPADSFWLIPAGVDDLWIRKHLAPMIAISDLIPEMQMRITHSQVVENKDVAKTIFHRGDAGDLVAFMPILRAMGGGKIVIGDHTGPNQGRESMKGARYEAIKPLLESQPYVHEVSWGEFRQGMTDVSNFRTDHRYSENLIQWQARHVGVMTTEEPWISVTAPNHGRPVFARSMRYRDPNFTWKRYVERHRNAIFVGLPEEHQDFQKWFGRVEFRPTRNLLELAQIIAGCSVFVGNQSCPFWIAAGLGVPLIQETWHPDPNSRVIRQNALYSAPSTGEQRLMAFQRSKALLPR